MEIGREYTRFMTYVDSILAVTLKGRQLIETVFKMLGREKEIRN